jgi:hypothetical protein
MPTNRDKLGKGVRYLIYALPLIFIGPSVIYNAFMNKANNWHYLVLAVGCIMCLSAMFLIFLGIKTITDSFFNDDK